MLRLPRLTERFLRNRSRLGITKDLPESAAVSRVIRELARDEALPGPHDTPALIPPTSDAFVRRVPGHNLRLWYRPIAESELRVLALTNSPPVPVDE